MAECYQGCIVGYNCINRTEMTRNSPVIFSLCIYIYAMAYKMRHSIADEQLVKVVIELKYK